MSLGRFFILFGALFLILGLFLIAGPKIQGLRHLGRLPGDIAIKRDGVSFYFPIVTCLALSTGFALILYLIRYFKGR